MAEAHRMHHRALMRAWLSLALLSLAPGCGNEHGLAEGDAGLPVDAFVAPTPDAFVEPPVDAAEPMNCHAVTVSSGHVAAATALLRYAPVHLVSTESGGCGCTPHVSVDPTIETVTMSACDCCETCPCIDEGYEGTVSIFIAEGMPAGARPQLTFEPPLTTTLVDPAHCVTSDVQVTSIVPIAPSSMLRQATPVSAWVQLNATALRCCGTALELVTPTVNADHTIDLTLAECSPDPCDCAATTPSDASTPVPLGELPSGTYTVYAGGVSTTLVIP